MTFIIIVIIIVGCLQGVEVPPTAPSPMPKSQSHANLRVDRISAQTAVSVEADTGIPAAPAQKMRRTMSKIGLETLEKVESMNCPIIEYSQLEIKRKIGDGSIGQVGARTFSNIKTGFLSLLNLAYGFFSFFSSLLIILCCPAQSPSSRLYVSRIVCLSS